MVTSVLLFNVAWTIWAVAEFGVTNGIGTIYHGSCSKTRRVNLWLHLVINAFNTVILSASNYCMQILSVLTRAEVDTAHSNKKSLDIGLPSVRNLRHISHSRLYLWLILGLSSVPLHRI